MLAYKGFTKELTARLGKGIFRFEAGKTYTEEECKTARNGFHCCENPFECLAYYPLNGGNRFWLVEAAGDIDEDESGRIACTEITLVKELSLKEFAGHGIMYIVKHPSREKWQKKYAYCTVESNQGCAGCKNDIAIARGEQPIVRGVIGSILGLICEREGKILTARLFEIDGEKYRENEWYTVNGEGIIVAYGKEVVA